MKNKITAIALAVSLTAGGTSAVASTFSDVENDKYKESIEYLKTEGYKKIRLGVDKGNPQSFSFWKKNGFKVK